MRFTNRLHLPVLLTLLFSMGGVQASEPDEGEHVVLRSGKILMGRVVGTMKMEKTQLLKVETDFGQILVPRKEVKKRVEDRRTRGGIFQLQAIRIVQWKGKVERRLAGSDRWRPIGEKDRYSADEGNVANSIVQPGDTLRTGPGGTIDLMPHKDVWIRIAPNSEVEIPLQREEGSIKLKRGKTIQKITGAPRGEVFRVRTQSSVVDHVFVLGGEDSFFSLEADESGDQLTVRGGSVRVNHKKVVKAPRFVKGRNEDRAAIAAELSALPDQTPRFPVDDYVYVPPGTYQVGGDGYIYNVDGLRTKLSPYGTQPFAVTLSGYLIDRREVAAGEFHDFVCANRHRPDLDVEYEEPPANRARWPVVNQRWRHARRFARWCGKDLPTEAQWEVAAHGGTDRRHPWGDGFGPEHRALNRGRWGGLWLPAVEFVSVDEPTADVSALGVRSLVSNATEWCRDDWSTSPFFEHMPAPPALSGNAVRGAYGLARLRMGMDPEAIGELVPGFRCVVEMK